MIPGGNRAKRTRPKWYIVCRKAKRFGGRIGFLLKKGVDAVLEKP